MNTQGARTRRSTGGMTLIEIIIVIALIALLTGTLVSGSGLFSGANRRAAATLLVSAVRKGLAHANATGKPVRLRIDIDAKTIVLEQASSVQVLVRDPDEEEKQTEADRLLKEAQAEGQRVLEGGGAPEPTFSVVDVLGGETDGPGRDLGKHITIYQVQTEHDPQPLTEGSAVLFFWPGGVTERAVIQLGQGKDDDGLTVEISPLTGRARIKRGRLNLPEPRFSDDEYSEREEL